MQDWLNGNELIYLATNISANKISLPQSQHFKGRSGESTPKPLDFFWVWFCHPYLHLPITNISNNSPSTYLYPYSPTSCIDNSSVDTWFLLRVMDRGGGWGEGYSVHFWVMVCRWDFGTLTLCQTMFGFILQLYSRLDPKNPYPIPDLVCSEINYLHTTDQFPIKRYPTIFYSTNLISVPSLSQTV